MAGLVKLSARTLVAPAVLPVQGVDPVAFRIYAPPTPPGFRYRQIAPDKPNSLATMMGWSPIAEVPQPLPSDSPFYGKTFVSLEELAAWLAARGLSSVSMPPGWSVVINSFTGNITGYAAPSMGTYEYEAWQAWLGNSAPTVYGPINHMEFVRFDGVPTESNGYPKGVGPFMGYADVPNAAGGYTRVMGLYRKYLTNGVLFRDSGDPAPAYSQFKTGNGILVVSGFPGAPAITAKPAQYVLDPLLGWNAGADSVQVLDGDVRVTFEVDVKVAGAVGLFRDTERPQGSPESLQHAFHFDFANGSPRWRVMESGVVKMGPFAFLSANVFRIERIAGEVTYSYNGEAVMNAPNAARGPLRVGAALYSSDDRVL